MRGSRYMTMLGNIMKRILLILITISSLNIIAQKRTKIFFKDYVECYYSDKETEPILIYDSPNGKIITELSVLTESHCWYKFAISESKNDWLKIENVIVLPACEENELNKNIGKYKDKWISTKINLEIDLPDSGIEKSNVGYNFYTKPTTNSKIVFTANNFLRTYLIDVDGTWAKLRVENNGIEYIGWLERKYQCPYPWTTCSVWE